MLELATWVTSIGASDFPSSREEGDFARFYLEK
jgi:hypothetical protein